MTSWERWEDANFQICFDGGSKIVSWKWNFRAFYGFKCWKDIFGFFSIFLSFISYEVIDFSIRILPKSWNWLLQICRTYAFSVLLHKHLLMNMFSLVSVLQKLENSVDFVDLIFQHFFLGIILRNSNLKRQGTMA